MYATFYKYYRQRSKCWAPKKYMKNRTKESKFYCEKTVKVQLQRTIKYVVKLLDGVYLYFTTEVCHLCMQAYKALLKPVMQYTCYKWVSNVVKTSFNTFQNFLEITIRIQHDRVQQSFVINAARQQVAISFTSYNRITLNTSYSEISNVAVRTMLELLKNIFQPKYISITFASKCLSVLLANLQYIIPEQRAVVAPGAVFQFQNVNILWHTFSILW